MMWVIMPDDELTSEQIKQIAEALDRVVKDLPWGQSVFLSAMGKKFEAIRDEFKRDVGVDDASKHKQKLDRDRFSLKDGQMEVFVSVYNVQGGDFQHWVRIIGNLTSQSISRPTYSDQKHVREMIRSKKNIMNEGFVSVFLTQDDFLSVPQERLPKDKLGNTLLVLKEKAITHDKIKKFFHHTGIYEYDKGLLKHVGNMSFSEDS
jgi:intracellular multiplication protein IcmQ